MQIKNCMSSQMMKAIQNLNSDLTPLDAHIESDYRYCIITSKYAFILAILE